MNPSYVGCLGVTFVLFIVSRPGPLGTTNPAVSPIGLNNLADGATDGPTDGPVDTRPKGLNPPLVFVGATPNGLYPPPVFGVDVPNGLYPPPVFGVVVPNGLNPDGAPVPPTPIPIDAANPGVCNLLLGI